MDAAPTFEEAMETSARLLRLWDEEQISDEVLADQVAGLVSHRNGARGFFVVALSGESALMDRLPEALARCLSDAGPPVVDLTARNLAMCTAMALHHGRRNNPGQQEGSLRVQERCIELLRVLDSAAVSERLTTLLAAARDGQGSDVAFLERWGYDADQRAAIVEAIARVPS
ncbi:hypothetical protein EVJ50_06490 [Synechococcus sp. RSCCF101]|uniref:hypothetical protein n=1 Tax=Synechococcus sp. RSCCF101 TaxID=2511069 RepID=UPI0012486412|nr:hypothetical protein [Synechococcus sp. RSCCF101]QEY31942.1 hypothetical protein EVJ50_06490 [Synechococcus sp. RSCCF101]